MPIFTTPSGRKVAVNPFYMITAEPTEDGDSRRHRLTKIVVNMADKTETIMVVDDFEVIAQSMDG